MSHQDLQKVPVTFHDVAAYFSEEDWKLLHKWQKELYKNVMKEIHQALISLGFKIINPDILLRIHKRENAYILDAEGQEGIYDHTSSCYPDVQPDVLFRIKQEELYCANWLGLKETEISNSPSKGFPFINEDICLRKEEEPSVSLMAYHGIEEEESSTSSSGNVVDGSIISFTIKEEGETYQIDHQEAERREIICNSIDDDIKCRNKINECSVKCGERAMICKASSGNAAAEVPQSTDKETNTRSTMWSESKKKLEGEKVIRCERFSNVTHSNSHHGNSSVQVSDTYKSKSKMGKSKLLKRQTNTQKNYRPHACSECEKSFYHKGDLTVHRRKHTGDTRYKCNECEKLFVRKQLLDRHHRTHSGERPYHCTECEKSFSWQEHLLRHQKIHIGYKPFQCIECKKSFSRKEHLIRHTQTHSGMRPYQCTECKKSFSQKQNLLAHKRTHTGERPFQCTKCEKSFRWKVCLIGHQKIHEERAEDSNNRRCNQRRTKRRIKTEIVSLH